jgi:hypothetical protein
MNKFAKLDVLVLTAVWFVLMANAAQAYFDLSTGTYLIQVVMAFAVTGWFSLKRVFVKPKPSVSTSSSTKPETEAPETSPGNQPGP